MWSVRSTLEFWMELTGKHERMVNGFDDFNQAIVGVNTTGLNAPVLELIDVLIITFSTVAVTLGDLSSAVDFGGQTALLEGTIIITEAHGPAGHVLVFLVSHRDNDDVFGVGVQFKSVGVLEAGITSGGNDCHLEAEAEAEIW